MWGNTFQPISEPRQPAAGGDPNDLRNFHVICPFMEKHDMIQIHCKGGSRIVLPTIAECRKYKQAYCCDNWKICPAAIAQTGIYPE